MTPKQRVLKALNHEEPDRVPFMYRDVSEVQERVKKDLGDTTDDELLEKLEIDFRWVGPEYVGPKLELENENKCDLWGVEWQYTQFGEGAGYWNEIDHPLKDAQTLDDLENYNWPQIDWYDFSKLEEQCDKYKDYAIMTAPGIASPVIFQSPIQPLLGVERSLMEAYMNPEFLQDAPEGDDSKVIMDRALNFIERKSTGENPFLSVIWFHTPHTPVAAGNDQRAKYSKQDMQGQHWFGAISAMDEQLGELRNKLRELNIEDNTIVWFCSDNGPSYIHNYNSSGGLRGEKAELYEGGVRVPAVLEWPAKIAKPNVSQLPLSTSDFYPTILAVCGIEMENQPQLDGAEMMNAILNNKQKRETSIRFQSPVPNRLKKQEIQDVEQFSIIENDFKLLSINSGESFQLYNLKDDPTENINIAKENSELVEKLKTELKKWQQSCEISAAGNDYK